MQRPFLIVETGRPAPELQRHGDFGHWIRVSAGLGRDEAVLCRVDRGDALPDRVEGFAGAIFSGSPSMVTDDLDWMRTAADWMRQAHQDGLPLFGICFGHQLLAHALGGQVGPNPRGREIGTVELRRTESRARDHLLDGLPERFPVQVTHLQSVLEAPPSAMVLATSDGDDCQMFRVGERSWGVQFHPEFSASITRGYLLARSEAVSAEGLDVKALSRGISAAPMGRRLLRRFIRHARDLVA